MSAMHKTVVKAHKLHFLVLRNQAARDLPFGETVRKGQKRVVNVAKTVLFRHF